MKVDPRWKVRGCALKKRLDQEKEEELKRRENRAAKVGPTMGAWIQKTSTVPLGEIGFGVRPTLCDTSTVEILEDEIE